MSFAIETIPSTLAFIPMPGLPELLVILLVVLVLFGPKKLPEIGKAIGQTVKELKKASNPQDDQKEDERK